MGWTAISMTLTDKCKSDPLKIWHRTLKLYMHRILVLAWETYLFYLANFYQGFFIHSNSKLCIIGPLWSNPRTDASYYLRKHIKFIHINVFQDPKNIMQIEHSLHLSTHILWDMQASRNLTKSNLQLK